jgi:cytochrome oxidase Cu insertion factor (SCO1/SenC/PrrC family)
MFRYSLVIIALLGAVVADAGNNQYPALPFSSDFGGSFKLTDHTGRVVTDGDFHGKYVILYFGYTDCPDICPLALSSIAQSLNRLEPDYSRITPLFVNLDPAKDSLENLEQYVHYFHPNFIGLTGSERAISLAAGSYGIRYRYVKNDDGTMVMEHSGKIFFIGPDGDVLTYFPHEASVDWMATVMDRHLRDGQAPGYDGENH